MTTRPHISLLLWFGSEIQREIARRGRRDKTCLVYPALSVSAPWSHIRPGSHGVGRVSTTDREITLDTNFLSNRVRHTMMVRHLHHILSPWLSWRRMKHWRTAYCGLLFPMRMSTCSITALTLIFCLVSMMTFVSIVPSATLWWLNIWPGPFFRFANGARIGCMLNWFGKGITITWCAHCWLWTCLPLPLSLLCMCFFSFFGWWSSSCWVCACSILPIFFILAGIIGFSNTYHWVLEQIAIPITWTYVPQVWRITWFCHCLWYSQWCIDCWMICTLWSMWWPKFLFWYM